MAERRFPDSPVFYRLLDRSFETAVRGEGVTIVDARGRSYIDACGGALVVNLGHGRKELADAMARQAADVAYVHGTQFTTDAIEDWAAALVAELPRGLDKLYLVPGGTEATETAIKLARQYHRATGSEGKFRTLGTRPSYHGNTIGALAVSGRQGLRAPYEPLLANEHHAPAPYCYRCPLAKTYPECGVACADAVGELFERVGPASVAAFVAEAVLGASTAAAVPPPEYLPKVREVCDRYDVLLIVDEILTGFGRTGTFFAVEPSGVEPDILLMGKGLTGGALPGGAVATRTAIVEQVRAGFGNFTHGFTFSHHPVVAAVAGEVLRLLDGEELVARVARLEAPFFEMLAELERFPFVGDIRGRGLLAGIELVRDRQTKEPFPRSRKLAEEIGARAFANGLLVYPSTGMANGVDGDAVVLAPPFVITEAEIEEVGTRLQHTFAEIEEAAG